MNIDEALRIANKLIEDGPYPRYQFVAQNAAVELHRAEKYARSIVAHALENGTLIPPTSGTPAPR